MYLAPGVELIEHWEITDHHGNKTKPGARFDDADQFCKGGPRTDVANPTVKNVKTLV